jgi:hypothetical protein
MKKHPAITTVKECLPGLMSFTLWLALRLTPAAAMPATNAPTAIPWNEIGAKASANYHGDGLAVMPAGFGACLHCVFTRAALSTRGAPKTKFLSVILRSRRHGNIRCLTPSRPLARCCHVQRDPKAIFKSRAAFITWGLPQSTFLSNESIYEANQIPFPESAVLISAVGGHRPMGGV